MRTASFAIAVAFLYPARVDRNRGFAVGEPRGFTRELFAREG